MNKRYPTRYYLLADYNKSLTRYNEQVQVFGWEEQYYINMGWINEEQYKERVRQQRAIDAAVALGSEQAGMNVDF